MFHSWIPTVSGRLSYSHIGEKAAPRPCLYVNHIGSREDGQAIFFQVRYCDDFVLPVFGRIDWVRNKIVQFIAFFSRRYRWRRLTGRHVFIAVVDKVTDRDQPLDKIKGRVFPIRTLSSDGENIGNAVAKAIEAEILRILGQEEKDRKEPLKRMIESIEARVSGVCPVIVHFSTSRNGLTDLEPGEPRGVPGRPLEKPEVTIRDYAEQAFFFLRDISHVHQHHDPRTDTIIRVHDDGADYRKQVYFDLFRHIIRFKRARTPDNIIRASGLLAYAKSFKSLTENEKDEKFPNDFQIENLKMSLDSAQFELEYRTQHRNSRFTLVLTIAFSFFGGLLSLAALSQFAPENVKSQIKPSEDVTWLTTLIAAHPIPTAVGSLLVGIVVMLATSRLRPHQFAWFENTQRLFNHRRRGFLGLILAMIAIVIIVFGANLYLHKVFDIGLFDLLSVSTLSTTYQP